MQADETLLQKSIEFLETQTKDSILHTFCQKMEGYEGGSLINLAVTGEMTSEGSLPFLVALLQHVPELMRLVNKLPREKYQFSDAVEVFAKCCAEHPPSDFDSFEQLCFEPGLVTSSNSQARNELICFLTALQAHLHQSLYRYRIVDRIRETEDSVTEYTNYIDDLFSQHSRLNCIRLDFCYRSDLDKEIELEELEAHLTKLHNNRRKNAMFKELHGYITKIGYSLEKKLYVKVLFFFDGNLQNDISNEMLAAKIGGYWVKNITKRTGLCFNHNSTKEFQEHGIGLIENGDLTKRKHLVNKIKELCAKDRQIIKPHGMPHKRLLNKGQLSKSAGMQ